MTEENSENMQISDYNTTVTISTGIGDIIKEFQQRWDFKSSSSINCQTIY